MQSLRIGIECKKQDFPTEQHIRGAIKFFFSDRCIQIHEVHSLSQDQEDDRYTFSIIWLAF